MKAGLLLRLPVFLVSASAGAGIVIGNLPSIWSPDLFVTLGIPMELGLIVAPFRSIGLRIAIRGNLNLNKIIWGPEISLVAGNIW